MSDSFLRAVEVFAYRTKNRLVNLFDPPVIVLLYHRVTTIGCDPQLLAVSPENFRTHLHFLKNNFRVVRFEEDWSKIEKPAIAITFDDGYSDNVREALPILEELEVPATFFVSTGTIGSREAFWWDELEHLVLGERVLPERFELDDRDFGKVWPTATVAERQVLYDKMQPLMRDVEVPRREGWLRQLREWVGGMEEITCEAHRVMTLEELRRLARSRWATVGAHTATHAKLSSLSREEQRREIIGSKRQLEAWLGLEVSVFSYPFGAREDYTGETVDLCRKAGFVKVAANFPAQSHSWTDPFQIPRWLVRNWPAGEFAAQLKEFWIS